MDEFSGGIRREAPTPLGVILGELVAGIRERVTMPKGRKVFRWKHAGKATGGGPVSRASRRGKRGGHRV